MLVAVLALSACSEASQDFHFTYFMPAENKIFYADQQQDTLHLVSTDRWTISVSDNWLGVTPTTGQPTGSQVSSDTRLNLVCDPNTTGKVRLSVINVMTENSVALPVYQLPWLRVRRPEPLYLNDENQLVNAVEATQMVCSLGVLSQSEQDSVRVYNYQPGATLKAAANDWFDKVDTTFQTTGWHTVRFTYRSNPTAQERETTLTFTSAGVSQQIVVRQAAKPED